MKKIVLCLMVVILFTGFDHAAAATKGQDRKKAAAAKKAADRKKAAGRKKKANWRTTFVKLDKNKDQMLSMKEFGAGLKGVSRRNVAAAFDKMQTELDPESTGRKTVSRDEFISGFKEYQRLRAAIKKDTKALPAGRGKKTTKKKPRAKPR